MGKVIRLYDKKNQKNKDLVEHVEHLLGMVKNGEITSLAIAGHHVDGDVVTGYFNLDVGEKMYMISHLQVDVNYEITRVNLED